MRLLLPWVVVCAACAESGEPLTGFETGGFTSLAGGPGGIVGAPDASTGTTSSGAGGGPAGTNDSGGEPSTGGPAAPGNPSEGSGGSATGGTPTSGGKSGSPATGSTAGGPPPDAGGSGGTSGSSSSAGTTNSRTGGAGGTGGSSSGEDPEPEGESTCVPGVDTGDDCDPGVDTEPCERSDRTCECGSDSTWTCTRDNEPPNMGGGPGTEPTGGASNPDPSTGGTSDPPETTGGTQPAGGSGGFGAFGAFGGFGASGGMSSGGTSTGETSSGGTSSGGTSSGGTSSGGTSSGGTSSGGTSTGTDVLLPTTCSEGDRTISNNGTGTHCGYTYEYWKDSGSGTLTLTSDGFDVNWSGINNLLGRKGVRPGTGNETVTYQADYQPNGNSYLCIYGWTRNPLVEYYIVDSWGSWRPPGGQGHMGTTTTDGGTYDLYRVSRTGPSIDGNTTFTQYFSVRTEKRTSGTITVGNHFAAWAGVGMSKGSMYEVSMTVEGYQSSGTASVSFQIQ